MAQIQVYHLAKSFGLNALLKDISFQMPAGEKAGLVGINGSGKTTLLRILAGQISPDSGEIHLPKRAAVDLLEWAAPQDGDSGPDEPLSGGERTRLALTRFLAEKPDLMLMDEPTNNLDWQGIRQALKLLKNCPSGMLIVSHDRYFLDNLVTRIFEIEDGRLIEYAGNYSFYRQEKERLFQERQRRYENDRKQQERVREAIRQTREWAEKSHAQSTRPDASGNKMGLKEYKRNKAKKLEQKAKNDIRRLEKMVKTSESKPKPEVRVYFSIDSQVNHGRRVLEATEIAKNFGDRVLFLPSSFTVQRGEKVAITGPNGCGKTTLVRMIQGLVQPDQGTLWLSPSCRPHVLAQQLEEMPAGQTLLEFFIGRLGRLDSQGRSMLAQLGITTRHLEQDTGSFSLGEQMKIKLAVPILARQDFLILDEPTNYLDLHARERLEEALTQYQGTLLVVSHDLYLLRKVCDKVLVFSGRQIRRLEQSFAEYLDAESKPAD